MKRFFDSIVAGSVLVALIASCSVTMPTAAEDKAFAQVRTVLEANCVHCHGDNRLSTMPSIHDTRALGRLVAAGTWIVPGEPDKSRFFQVVTFSDNVPGAMPPTGHAVGKSDVEILRAWIQSGAALPKVNLTLKPRGAMPRSI